MTKMENLMSNRIHQASSGLEYFEHFNAKTVAEAVSLLSQYKGEAKLIAGGVDLVSLMRSEITAPKALVNIKTIPDLAYIQADAQGLKIGSLTSVADIAKSALVQQKYNLLAEAAHSVGAPTLRSMATIGGNLCQEVRCWYYRRAPATGLSFFCYRKGGKDCYATKGENTYHAIIGGKKCVAVCPSDMAVALVALEAKVKVIGTDGEKAVPLARFYTTLGTVLKPEEMIVEVQVPTPRPGTKGSYLKFRLRKAIDFAIVSTAAAITMEAGIVRDARIILGGVAPTPYRAKEAEEALDGETVTEAVAVAAAAASVAKAVPLSKNAYKLPIAKALVKRAIMGLH